MLFYQLHGITVSLLPVLLLFLLQSLVAFSRHRYYTLFAALLIGRAIYNLLPLCLNLVSLLTSFLSGCCNCLIIFCFSRMCYILHISLLRLVGRSIQINFWRLVKTGTMGIVNDTSSWFTPLGVFMGEIVFSLDLLWITTVVCLGAKSVHTCQLWKTLVLTNLNNFISCCVSIICLSLLYQFLLYMLTISNCLTHLLLPVKLNVLLIVLFQ
jgi:hypothetical protein